MVITYIHKFRPPSPEISFFSENKTSINLVSIHHTWHVINFKIVYQGYDGLGTIHLTWGYEGFFSEYKLFFCFSTQKKTNLWQHVLSESCFFTHQKQKFFFNQNCWQKFSPPPNIPHSPRPPPSPQVKWMFLFIEK